MLNREGCTAMRPQNRGPVSFLDKINDLCRIGRDLLRVILRHVFMFSVESF